MIPADGGTSGKSSPWGISGKPRLHDYIALLLKASETKKTERARKEENTHRRQMQGDATGNKSISLKSLLFSKESSQLLLKFFPQSLNKQLLKYLPLFESLFYETLITATWNDIDDQSTDC